MTSGYREVDIVQIDPGLSLKIKGKSYPSKIEHDLKKSHLAIAVVCTNSNVTHTLVHPQAS